MCRYVKCILLAALAFPQIAQFETASIKPSAPGNIRGATYEFLPAGGLRVINGTLKGMIETGYDLRDFQIFGGPGWVDSERFDVLAKGSAANATAEIKSIRLNLQTLLAQRFQLQVHRETKDLPEYALTIAKNGPILTADSATTNTGGIQRSCGEMVGTRATMANMVFMLSRQLDRPVLDQTGLEGKYNFQFEWTPDTGPCPGASDDNPSIFTALQEKLGLKLESIKGPVDSLVIDHAERPSPN